MNFQRLNHILIPGTKDGRDRLRKTRTGKLVRPVVWFYLALTDEGRVLSILWLICGAAGMEVGSTQIYLMFSVLTGLLVASFVMRRAYRLDATARVETPERITAGEVAVLPVCVKNDTDEDLTAIRIQRPLLPWDGRYVGDAPSIPEVKRGSTARSLVRATFVARGEHHLDPFYAARVVPFNITQGAPVATGGARFLVVPKPANVQSLALPMAARYQPGGVHMAARIGESMEFVGLRPYRPGDRVRDLHVRTWARLGEPVVREYEQEYFTRVGVVLDTDGGVATEEALEAGICLAAGAVMHLSRGEALIDLLVVGDAVHRLTLGRHLGAPEEALDLLAVVEPGPALDPDKIAGVLTPHLPRLSCVVLILLAWDEARQALAERVRRGGVACRVLLVGDREGAGLTPVPVASIRDGAALSL